VGYHDVKIVKEYRVEKSNEIVNRLNKTKQELFPDLEAEKNAWVEARTRERRDQAKEQKRREKAEREELLSYDRIMDSDDMVTNKELKEKYQSVEDWEDDFM